MNFELLRKIARSNKYQLLYSQVKEIGSLKLFKNREDLTKVQLLFLNWLSIYQSLYTDIATGEKYISEEVLKDELRTQAYLLYKDNKKNKKTDKKNEKEINTESNIPSVIFTRK